MIWILSPSQIISQSAWKGVFLHLWKGRINLIAEALSFFLPPSFYMRGVLCWWTVVCTALTVSVVCGRRRAASLSAWPWVWTAVWTAVDTSSLLMGIASFSLEDWERTQEVSPSASREGSSLLVSFDLNILEQKLPSYLYTLSVMKATHHTHE